MVDHGQIGIDCPHVLWPLRQVTKIVDRLLIICSSHFFFHLRTRGVRIFLTLMKF